MLHPGYYIQNVPEILVENFTTGSWQENERINQIYLNQKYLITKLLPVKIIRPL